jgi:hypothetical protein
MERMMFRLEIISNRLDARLTILENAGVTVATARTEHDAATEALASARNRLIAIDQAVSALVSSNNLAREWSNVRTIYTTTGSDLRSAHARLVAAEQAARSALADTPTP